MLITGHRERSLAGLPVPFNPNTAPARSFENIPGIGRDRASAIILARPFSSIADFGAALGSVSGELREIILRNSVI